MPLQVPNGYGIVTMHWNFVTLARQVSVTCGVRDTLATNDANAIATQWKSSITNTGAPALASNMTTAWQYLSTTVLLRTTTGFLVTGANLVAVNGTATPPAGDIPVYTPIVVSKQTAFAGRAFRGRMYPPFTLAGENVIDAGGAMTGATQTALQTAWSNFLGNINGTQYPAFLLHTDVGLATPSPNAIASLLVRPVTGIQRRRRTRGA